MIRNTASFLLLLVLGVYSQNVELGSFPYHVIVQGTAPDKFTWYFECSGALLTPSWVITSGSCVDFLLPGFAYTRVVAGIVKFKPENPERQESAIAQSIVHPNYTSWREQHQDDEVNSENRTLYSGFTSNDVALLQLETPFTIDDFVKTVSLPPRDYLAIGEANLTGWNSFAVGDYSTSSLKNTAVNIEESLRCENSFEEIFGDNDYFGYESNLCTDLSFGRNSTNIKMVTNIGGPLVQDDVLVGIVCWEYTLSLIDDDDVLTAPPVYTNVTYYLDFINEYVADLQL